MWLWRKETPNVFINPPRRVTLKDKTIGYPWQIFNCLLRRTHGWLPGASPIYYSLPLNLREENADTQKTEAHCLLLTTFWEVRWQDMMTWQNGGVVLVLRQKQWKWGKCAGALSSCELKKGDCMRCVSICLCVKDLYACVFWKFYFGLFFSLPV